MGNRGDKLAGIVMLWGGKQSADLAVFNNPASLQHRQKFVPLAKGWIDAGISVGQMRDAVAKARSEAKEGIAYLPSYVDRVLASMSAGAAVVAAAQAGESFATKDYGTKVGVL